MRFLISFLKAYFKKTNIKVVSDHKQDDLVKYGREQFKTLIRKGLSVPVVLL